MNQANLKIISNLFFNIIFTPPTKINHSTIINPKISNLFPNINQNQNPICNIRTQNHLTTNIIFLIIKNLQTIQYIIGLSFYKI